MMSKELNDWLDSDDLEYKPSESFIQAMETPVFQSFFASVLIGRLNTNNDIGANNVIDIKKATSIKHLQTMIELTTTQYEALFLENYTYASEVSRLAVYDFKTAIESSLAKAREQGLSKDEWIKTLGKPEILEGVGANTDKPWYWENVYRTNNQTAYNAGVWDRTHETPEKWFGYEYIAIDDKRTTDICRDLNGTIASIDDPVWATYTPPNHFQCRSIQARYSKTIAKKRNIQMKPAKDIAPFPTKSFEGNSAEKWATLHKSQRDRINEYGIAGQIETRNKSIEKNIKSIIKKTP